MDHLVGLARRPIRLLEEAPGRVVELDAESAMTRDVEVGGRAVDRRLGHDEVLSVLHPPDVEQAMKPI
jgi:hypothetical protein